MGASWEGRGGDAGTGRPMFQTDIPARKQSTTPGRRRKVIGVSCVVVISFDFSLPLPFLFPSSPSQHPHTMSRPARLLGALTNPRLTRPNSSFIHRLTTSPPPALVLPHESKIPRSLNAAHQSLPPASSPQHTHINHPARLFPTTGPAEWPQVVEQNSQQVKEKVLRGVTGLDVDELRGLNRYTVVLKRVVNMTKKGKM